MSNDTPRDWEELKKLVHMAETQVRPLAINPDRVTKLIAYAEGLQIDLEGEKLLLEAADLELADLREQLSH